MNHLKRLRIKAKLSQNKLAVLCGWIKDGKTTSRIANYESGKRVPSLDDCREIVRALNSQGLCCSLDDVFPPKRKDVAA